MRARATRRCPLLVVLALMCIASLQWSAQPALAQPAPDDEASDDAPAIADDPSAADEGAPLIADDPAAADDAPLIADDPTSDDDAQAADDLASDDDAQATDDAMSAPAAPIVLGVPAAYGGFPGTDRPSGSLDALEWVGISGAAVGLATLTVGGLLWAEGDEVAGPAVAATGAGVSLASAILLYVVMTSEARASTTSELPEDVAPPLDLPEAPGGVIAPGVSVAPGGGVTLGVVGVF